MPLPAERLPALLRDLVTELSRLLTQLDRAPSAAARGAFDPEGLRALEAVLGAAPEARAEVVLDQALILRALSLRVSASGADGPPAPGVALPGAPAAAAGVAAAQAAVAAVEVDLGEGRAAPAVDLDALLVDAFALMAGVLALCAAHAGALRAVDEGPLRWLLAGGARLRDGRGWRARPPAERWT
jgi:hypothetical protein